MRNQRGRQRNEREKSEYDQKVLDMARVTRVVAGGRRFSFRATVGLGNKKGKIGIGIGKGLDVSQAVDKAVAEAKKNMIVIVLKGGTIPHEVEAKYSSAKVFLKPASLGNGLVAGGATRIICSLAGIENITAKIISKSTNKLNNAKATLEALKKLKSQRVNE
ncbi:30S ribosomal protein S5 [Patescibacteria group bacterium]|nr:30S ribosomal protein S5 [Patescibacteria group bacterium]MBU2220000.1 30S ribosomal protein S5 [Patescibacteria group bacterium]MBU2264556.1 30S ribosomal protein S5 [Patescibacteria group bacterium]